MQAIVLHSPGCQALADKPGELHVVVKELDSLVEEVYGLMQRHRIPFYQVQPHNHSCPGPRFPYEDLEFKLFTLEH